MKTKKLTKYQQRFSQRIRALRMERGLSIPLIVEAFNRRIENPISQATWEMWESTSPRRHREPPVSAYPALATVLGLDDVCHLLPEQTIKRRDKPLFVPLKTEYFEQFKSGEKDTEYRRYGERWNETTCWVGRDVVLSKGYSKGQRLKTKIVGFSRRHSSDVNEKIRTAIEKLYGFPVELACIKMGPVRKLNE